MDQFDPVDPKKDVESATSDLAQRLARYRRRVEAEGRSRSVKVIDQAIEEAGKKSQDDE